jgi:hypothetical protein
MKLSESPIITFIRGITLLAILVALPGIAVCWNHLPKDLWSESAPKPVTTKVEKSQHFWKDSGESAKPISVFAPESIYPALPETDPVLPKMQTKFRQENAPVPTHWDSQNVTVQQVSWEHSPATPPQDFEALEFRLKSLGATYYKLEKWGNRGELFRFSCFVASSDGYTYEKHFQSIGSDVVTVMQTVIADIERWKNVR